MQEEQGYLIKRYCENQHFKNQADRAYIKYLALLEQAKSYDFSDIHEDVIAKFPHQKVDIFFYYGFQHDCDPSLIHRNTLYFLQKFPKPYRPYVFVFFNNKAHYDVYGQLRAMFYLLTLDHFNFLQAFYVIRSSIYHRASDYIAYETISRYLKSKTHYKGSGNDLCSILNIDPQDFVDFAPQKIAYQEFPQLKPRQIKIVDQRINFEGQRRNQDEKFIHNKFQQTIKAFLFVKPGKQTHTLNDYEMSRLGIPIVLEILVYYFKTHPQGLELEGLFRKSVSIDDENQLLLKIAQQNYECLLQVKNPHICANLIKRFFSNLKIPVFPFNLFEKLMNDQGVKNKVQFIKSIVDQLPQLHYRSLLYLLRFLKEDVSTKHHLNKMPIQNIAICFAPSLMRSQKTSAADIMNINKSVIVTTHLLQNLEEIFGNQERQLQIFRQKQNEHKRIFEETVEFQIQQSKNSPIRKSNSMISKNSSQLKEVSQIKKDISTEQSKKVQQQPQKQIKEQTDQTLSTIKKQDTIEKQDKIEKQETIEKVEIIEKEEINTEKVKDAIEENKREEMIIHEYKQNEENKSEGLRSFHSDNDQ